DATIPLDSRSSGAPGWGQRFDENLNNQYLRSQADGGAYPSSSAAGAFAGSLANPVNKFIVAKAPDLPSAVLGRSISGALNGDAFSQRMHQQGQDQAGDIARGIRA